MKILDAYYEDTDIVIEGYIVRVGYIPETKQYIVARNSGDPYFCFSDNTKEKAIEKARDAMRWYVNNGLKE